MTTSLILFLIGTSLGFVTGFLIKRITFTRVENCGKKPTADSFYWKLSTSKEDFLFTEEQLRIARARAEKNPEDV